MNITDQMKKMAPEKLWAYSLSIAASGFYTYLIEERKFTDTDARNHIIHDLVACAAGEACRLAHKEGRNPNQEKWRSATDRAFTNAVEHTDRCRDDYRDAPAS